MGIGVWAVAMSLATVVGSAAVAAAEPEPARKSACQMQMAAELKVTFQHNEPLVDAHIDGRPLRVLFDTGASTTTLMRSSAQALGLQPVGQEGAQAVGVGGFTSIAVTRIKDLDLSGFHFDNLSVYVVGERASSIDMLMGRNFMARYDIELDLGHGRIRLLKPKNCKSEEMAYWATSYSQAPLRPSYPGGPYLIDVQLNGRTVHAQLDSGAGVTVASPDAAARAGAQVKTAAGVITGVGSRSVDSGVATLDSFAVGDETIRRTQVRVADLFKGVEAVSLGSHISQRYADLPEMMLGADFLKSHRVLISPTQRMVYFTYEGGPVFDATSPPPPPQGAAGAAGQAASSRTPAGS